MVSIPFHCAARDVIGFLRSLAPATKVTKEQTPGAKKKSPLFEIASVLVRLNHVPSGVVNADHRIMCTG
jgi:hypothetical protein